MALGQEYLLASPVQVLGRLARMLAAPDTRLRPCARAGASCWAFCWRRALAPRWPLAARFPWVRDMAAPLVSSARAVPVASFVILAIILVSTRWLSTLIAFVIGFPLVYGNVMEGIRRRDRGLTEVARVFRVPAARRLMYVDLPQILPYFKSGAVSAMGLCWKSGIAAELIGIPDGTIGEKLYIVKVNLYTPELFAWTVIIVLLSGLAGRLAGLACDAAARGLERM